MFNEKDFPHWSPQRYTWKKFKNPDFKVRYTALRNASSNFTKRQDVREYILNKCNHKCAQCGSNENLQIDHIVSVYQCAIGELPANKLNTSDNLQILCFRCNAGKAP
jgi:5-methylcytosine-specific restriction endonuclease McrA